MNEGQGGQDLRILGALKLYIAVWYLFYTTISPSGKPAKKAINTICQSRSLTFLASVHHVWRQLRCFHLAVC